MGLNLAGAVWLLGNFHHQGLYIEERFYWGNSQPVTTAAWNPSSWPCHSFEGQTQQQRKASLCSLSKGTESQPGRRPQSSWDQSLLLIAIREARNARSWWRRKTDHTTGGIVEKWDIGGEGGDGERGDERQGKPGESIIHWMVMKRSHFFIRGHYFKSFMTEDSFHTLYKLAAHPATLVSTTWTWVQVPDLLFLKY